MEEMNLPIKGEAMSTTIAIPRLGVGAVILNDKNEILLVLRNRDPEKNMWSIPGGKVDPYEQLETSVIREIKEEVNLDVKVKALLCTAETIRPESAEHWVSVIYEVTILSGEARNLEEGGAIGDMRWYSLDALPSNLACFAVPAIEHLQNRNRS
ncbi:DNA mismatch repair protein MutT [Brevibacillus formosus]|nr:DNA mismatch repair protein MutT [Brevibacillus formosus]